MDTQTIELLGRNRLVNELLLAGLEVAQPMRDRGVDLIAYVDLSAKVHSFVAAPIQMKAASIRSFGVNKKYAKISDLILAHVWHLETPEKAVTFALSYPEAVAVAEEMGWTTSGSWNDKGGYGTTNPSKKLCKLLDPYRMTPELWWERITGKVRK